VSWPGADVAPLVKAGLEARSIDDALGDEAREAVESAGRTWARLWGRLPLLDGKSFRELVSWRKVSLLWLAEAFIRDETAGPRCARLAEVALRLLDATRPDEVDAVGLPAPAAVLLARACTVRGVLYHGSVPRVRPLRLPVAGRRWPALVRLAAPWKRPPGLPGPPGTRTVSLLVLLGPGGDAESLGPLLRAAEAELGAPGMALAAEALGRWETRRVRRAVAEARRHLHEQGERLRRAPGVHESYTHRGVGFADLAGGDLDAILRRRLPEGVRLLETAVELLTAAGPAVLGLVGWRRDERRALLAAADAASTATVVLRIGVEDPDDLDRADGGPQARATIALDPGGDPAPTLAGLREAARATFEPA
jgi:hypothetical protein